MALHRQFENAVAQFPDRTAVCERNGAEVSYTRLDGISNAVRDRLHVDGVKRGDRVGIYLCKSIDSVAAILGILKVGATYVPVDPTAPATRNAFILSNCAVTCVIVERCFVDKLKASLGELNAHTEFLIVDEVGAGAGIDAAVRAGTPCAPTSTIYPDGAELAYILYTSGSTGKPKGVQITHENASSFVGWCNELLNPTEDDRFSSHAPFHFDLSILDIYTPLGCGACIVLIDADTGKAPRDLAEYISSSGITVWYSAPSILTMLVQFGSLQSYDYGALRTVLFAGEVFPVGQLRALKHLWSQPEYFNLYGPTETNVCTFYKIPDAIPDVRMNPFPIGKVCSHLQSRVVDETGSDVPRGSEGELCISGPSVTPGYWQLPDVTSAAYLASDDGIAWYRTGDIVHEDERGDFVFNGRRDRMVKRRGNRIELGEIESCLYQHCDVIEVAVVAVEDKERGVEIIAHLATKSDQRLSIIKLKQFCAERIPLYMIPDTYAFHVRLPKTSTDKIDYQSLINPKE